VSTKVYRSKKRRCALCRPDKVGWASRWSAKDPNASGPSTRHATVVTGAGCEALPGRRHLHRHRDQSGVVEHDDGGWKLARPRERGEG
jgi:hypothetical protein